MDSVEKQTAINLKSVLSSNEKATKGLIGSRTIEDALAHTKCMQPIILKNVKTGLKIAKCCGSRIDTVCHSCASRMYESLIERAETGLFGVSPDQCVLLTVTFPDSVSWKTQAERNSVLPELLKNLEKRIRRTFGRRFKSITGIELVGTTCHAHVLIVLNRPMTAVDRATIADHSRRVKAYLRGNKKGRKYSFGHTYVKQVQSVEHLEHLLEYPFKNSKSSLVELSNNEETALRMDRYIASLRNRGRHRLRPLKSGSQQGGCGFRGRRIKFSSNWDSPLPPDSELAISYYDSGSHDEVRRNSKAYSPLAKSEWVFEAIAPFKEAPRGRPKHRPPQ